MGNLKLKPRLLYVAGYGRSGSTLLCAVLGGGEHYVPVGEFKGIFSHFATDRICSCGRVLNECPFWSDVVEDFNNEHPGISMDQAATITTRMESYTNWFSLRYRGTELERTYKAIWMTMVSSVCERSGCETIVDASKSSSIACNRVAVMSRLLSVQHVHLVRDPRSVMSSTLVSQQRRLDRHGIKATPLRGLRTLLSWTATNAYLQLMHLLGLQRIHARVSYEMLTNSPAKCIDRLAISLSLDLAEQKEKLEMAESFTAGHIFSGDLQRMKGEYQIKPQSLKWPSQLTKQQKILALITYPLARYYGFFVGGIGDKK